MRGSGRRPISKLTCNCRTICRCEVKCANFFMPLDITSASHSLIHCNKSNPSQKNNIYAQFGPVKCSAPRFSCPGDPLKLYLIHFQRSDNPSQRLLSIRLKYKFFNWTHFQSTMWDTKLLGSHPDIQISDYQICLNTEHFSPLFRYHSNYVPLNDWSHFYHLNSAHVCFSDPHCLLFRYAYISLPMPKSIIQ